MGHRQTGDPNKITRRLIRLSTVCLHDIVNKILNINEKYKYQPTALKGEMDWFNRLVRNSFGLKGFKTVVYDVLV